MGANVIWQGCPTVEEEMPRYAIITVGDNSPYVYDMGAEDPGCVSLRDVGREFQVLFSTENSLNPSPDNVWGMPDDSVIFEGGWSYVRIVKGGKPYVVRGERDILGGSVNIIWDKKLARVSATLVPSLEDADMVFMNGYMVPWAYPSESNRGLFDDFQLVKTDSGIFEGVFYFPEATSADEPQFRFFTDFQGWIYDTSIGSVIDDCNQIPVDFSNDGLYTGPLVPGGCGNWLLTASNDNGFWEGGWLKVTVNLVDNLLTLKKTENGAVDGIIDDTDAPARWYNLQGVEVQNPSNGLYIRKTSKGSSKVLLR
jgi:hypothetical protein